MSDSNLEHNTSVIDSSSKKMKQILLILRLSGLALCGSLSNEYLPANDGVVINSAAGSFGGAIGSYSPMSRFSGNAFGSSSLPAAQYGVPGQSTLKSQFGGQYAAPSQYNRPAAPVPVYGAPSQNFGVSSFRSASPFSSGQSLSSGQYGVPVKSSGVSSFGPRTSFSSGAQSFPSVQYGAPSAFGTQQSFGVGSSPSHYNSQIGQNRGISTQYGAPQRYHQPAQFGQSASFRSGPQFGGLSSHGGFAAHRPATGYSGTVQDANGGYIY